MIKILFIVSLLACINLMGQTVIPPVYNCSASFAIVVDKDTYDNTTTAILAYQKMLGEKEHLSAFILLKDWQNPDEVKKALKTIASSHPHLEGAVFVGNIPVALIRNAQHMTTAFKMDEIKYPIQQSSVASDRFYDDFDLSFRFLQKDNEKKGWFYYELEESSPQVIQSDIYTARIMSHRSGAGQYQDITDYLLKAIAVRTHPEPLDHLLAFTGYGYNSESLTAWVDEQSALKELFPAAFRSATTSKMLNYRMNAQMKFSLFTELQRPELDLAILSDHGDIAQQYLNESPSGNDIEFSMESMKLFARSSIRGAVKRGQDTLKLKSNFRTRFHLDDFWFEGAFENDSLLMADSLLKISTEICKADLQQFNPQSKVIIMNSCFNGSFHHPDNIAEAYIFSPGNTLVVQGNTTNVLQDKWAIDHIGLINEGVRIGLWAFQCNTLESHLFGDPTWHFSKPNNLNSQLISQQNNPLFWKQFLNRQNPALQSLALKKLFDLKISGLSEVLLQTYRTSLYLNVRMQCLNLLCRKGGKAYAQILPLALKDPYELIRRKAAEWSAGTGSVDLIPILVSMILENPNDARVNYDVKRCFEVLDPSRLEAEIKSQVTSSTYLYNRNEVLENWLREVAKNRKRASECILVVTDRQNSEAKRLQFIRILRNSTYHHYVPVLIKIAEDTSESMAIRENMIEALGWFSISYQKPLIIAACQRITKSVDKQSFVYKEAKQTIARLEDWSLK